MSVNTVVVMNMHYSGLGIARDLAGSGVRVIGLSFDSSFFGNRSRYCEFRLYPNAQFAPSQCLDYLVDLSEEIGGKPLLLPTRDLDILFIMQFRQTIDEHYTLAYPDNQVLENIVNKDALYSVAQGLSIPCPSELLITSLAQLESEIDTISLPVIAKPVVAADWRHPEVWKKVGGCKVRVFSSAEDIVALYRDIESLAPRLSLQKYIAGPDSDLRIVGAYKARRGSFSYFSLRKLLQYPKEAGTGIVLESCPAPDLAEQSDLLLSELGYHGMAEIEYKYDAGLDKYVLIEINSRHWDQHSLGPMVGVNLTRLLLDDMSGAAPATRTPLDTKARWLAEDQYVRHLVAAIFGREYGLRYYLGCAFGRKRLAVFSLSDPMPFLALVIESFKAWSSKVGRRAFSLVKKSTKK